MLAKKQHVAERVHLETLIIRQDKDGIQGLSKVITKPYKDMTRPQARSDETKFEDNSVG